MALTPEEEAFVKQQEIAMRSQQAQIEASNINQYQQQQLLQEQERSMIQDQLDVSEDLERIRHLLKGDYEDEDGNWQEAKDGDMIILAPYGIHLIMNTIRFYINKNKLLSNYDEDTINQKMEDFAEALNDTIFMEYEKVFKYPSFDDCRQVLEERIKRKVKVRKFNLEQSNVVKDEKEIIKELWGGIDIEKELEKVKQQIIKNKLKRFLILLRSVQDTIHDTYLRAWKGQERSTLRTHMHISEMKGGGLPNQQQGSKFNPFNWMRSN